ncbi:unnamed protein product [Sphagnum jensenii]|uniref:Trafficking protein particle complex subunit 8 n=1 Tax=Sphagnum jensenii TaxID=128206 RepID=A0ABP0VVP7_9BRYO
MEAAGAALAHLMRDRFSPVVMVLSTPRAEESCRKNHLGFVDLLRPFSVLDQINVPVRTASEQPYRLQDFQLRIFNASEIRQPSPEIAEEHLVEIVTNSSDDAVGALQGDPANIEVVKQMAESETQVSWFQRYSKSFMSTLAFSEHEALDHPVACLLVVSSKDESPLSQFVDLFNGNQLPRLLNEGAMDPKILKHYVLLHDVQDGALDGCNEILFEMRGAFGVNNCGVLPINSGAPDVAFQLDFWTRRSSLPIIPSSHSTSELVCIVSSDVQITDFLLDVTLKQVIPHMEQKIRMLNQQVSATRKGLKNQLKNLWWRKGKDDTPDVQTGPVYTFSSMESQIRVLADYAFMLRDYDLALSNYRLLSSDYKTDKAWKHYAGVQEMIGLCLFMLDQSRREAEMCLDTAYNYYQKCGGLTAKYATRTALWLSEMHKARGQFREAAGVLFRASVEELDLRAGVLLEQAAYCYLRASPPMLRKFGFHLVLAGNRYIVCAQHKHAMRVYRSALSIFEDQGWKYISDHVHFHLGRLSHFLGSFDLAILHFMKLISCSHQSPTNQSNFLREFLYVVQNTVGKDKLLELDLPAVKVENVCVHFEDHRTYASSAAAAAPEEIWGPVEEGLLPAVTVTLHTWMDAPSKSLPQVKDFNICVAGEDIGVDVEFSNPLQIPIDISSICLSCEFIETAAASEEIDSQISKEETADISASPLFLPQEAFSLKPEEKIVVRLMVKPLKEGVLKVVGVNWILSGVAAGHRDFAVLGPRIKRSKSGARDEPLPHQRLKFHVLRHMPRLDVSVHELPARVNSGELHRVVLELYNPSKVPVKKLKLKSSHSNSLLVGDPADLDMEFPSCLEVQAQEGQQEVHNAESFEQDSSPSGLVFSFPEGTVLEGGSTVLWPLWFHASHAGMLSINTVIYYESDGATVGLMYRTVRMTHTIQVLPALCISVQISPSPMHLQQFFLRLDVENQHLTESFWLRQVSCAGDHWCLAPLLPPMVEQEGMGGTDTAEVRAAFLSASVCPSQLLPPSQTLSLFFKLLVAQHKGRSSSEEVTSNIGLGPPSSSEPLIDISSGPLFRFLLSATNPMSDSGSVDVVLISEQQEGMGTVQDSLRVGAHHVCHCSVQGAQPFVWVMEAPKCVVHDFWTQPFCEVSVTLTIRNCSIFAASVRVETLDLPSAASSQTTQGGWTSLGVSTPPSGESSKAEPPRKSTSGVPNTEVMVNRASCGPFLWCNLQASTIHTLPAGASAKVPLRIAFFAPGSYDLSRYRISWTLLEFEPTSSLSTAATSKEALGTGLGHPLLLTVVQSIT